MWSQSCLVVLHMDAQQGYCLVFISQRSELRVSHVPVPCWPMLAHSLPCHAHLCRCLSVFLFAFWVRVQLSGTNDLCSACPSPPPLWLPGFLCYYSAAACRHGLPNAATPGVEWRLCWTPPSSFGSPRLHHPSLHAVMVQSG